MQSDRSQCGNTAIVGLNGKWVCMDCFDSGLKAVRATIDRILGMTKQPTDASGRRDGE